MNEPITIAAPVPVSAPPLVLRRRVCLIAIILANWLVFCGALLTGARWADYWGLESLPVGVFFSQLYLLSLWGAWRGGSRAVRLGVPFLVVVGGGFLAFEVLASYINWPIEYAILPVPLGVMYLLGVIVLLPFRWWSGKALVFADEEISAARPRQFRIHHFVGWTLLLSLGLGLARASGAGGLVTADIVILVLLPAILLYIAMLSIPMVRGVFARSRPILWSFISFLLVIFCGMLVGSIVCGWVWQERGRRISWWEYELLLLEVVYFHASSGIVVLANLAAVRRLGATFRGVK